MLEGPTIINTYRASSLENTPLILNNSDLHDSNEKELSASIID